MTFDLFDLGRVLHGSIGIIALIAFWVAALAVKGSQRHRRAGRVYLPAMLLIMGLSLLMVAGQAIQKSNPGIAIYLLFLISMVGTASWLMWFSVRYKHDPQRFLGKTYRALATWLVVFGSGVLVVIALEGRLVGIFLSLLGIGFGVNMWRLALTKASAGRPWWLQHHMNGVMLNFIATHDSFIALGIGSLVPELREPVPRMLVAVTVTAVGIGLRAWMGRRHLKRSPPTAAGSPQPAA
jgi:hypothetical protein